MAEGLIMGAVDELVTIKGHRATFDYLSKITDQIGMSEAAGVDVFKGIA